MFVWTGLLYRSIGLGHSKSVLNIALIGVTNCPTYINYNAKLYVPVFRVVYFFYLHFVVAVIIHTVI
jgi:hypothetical protein